MDKKLLRKIKQEGIGNSEYTNEFLDNAIIADYQITHSIPITDWSTNKVLTRLQELQHLAYLLHIKYPRYYSEVYYYTNGEYWDIQDEIDNRYSSYYHYRHELDY